jgi:acetylcholinesterase
MHDEFTAREKSGDRRCGDATHQLASSTSRDNLTMATSTLRSRLLCLASASLVGLLGFWIWWFKAGGGHILPIPLIMRPAISVVIPQGKYVGIEARSGYPQPLELFLGIPYALSTAGERRFRPPVAVGTSDETFDASNYGNICPSGPPDNTHVSEDCLNLNIYRPKERSQDKLLPVLVHIHGGAFNGGFGHSRQVSNLVAWASEPFIGISFNYRLGALGFLPSKVTADEGLLNLGLKDQALLLEWVQKNIEAFGGNPDDVTLMGSSAGAHSVRSSHLKESDSLQ